MTVGPEERLSLLRYCHDSLDDTDVPAISRRVLAEQEEVKRQSLAQAVRVFPSLMPDIAKAVEIVQRRILPGHSVEVFVRSSPEVQAFSLAGPARGPVFVAVTSGLVNLFSSRELMFVLGHELGHHIMQHHNYPAPDSRGGEVEALNVLALRRAAEISADRVGFVACNGREDCWRALLKLASGLSEPHLRFDVAKYLDQFREVRELGGTSSELLSTHPMITVRIRALIWFEISQTYAQYCDTKSDWTIDGEAMDLRIEKDLASASGFRLDEINNRAVQSAYTWGLLALLVADKRFSKDEQTLLARALGDDEATKAIAFAREHGPAAIEKKLEGCLQGVRSMPRRAREDLFSKLQDISLRAEGPHHLKQNVLQVILRRLSLE